VNLSLWDKHNEVKFGGWLFQPARSVLRPTRLPNSIRLLIQVDVAVEIRDERITVGMEVLESAL
jgi:hypothetical protein